VVLGVLTVAGRFSPLTDAAARGAEATNVGHQHR